MQHEEFVKRSGIASRIDMKTIGILRKSNYQTNVEPSPDLLVFGYQSKLYRDDRKALELDRETHLIPAPYERKDLISRLLSNILTTSLLN